MDGLENISAPIETGNDWDAAAGSSDMIDTICQPAPPPASAYLLDQKAGRASDGSVTPEARRLKI